MIPDLALIIGLYCITRYCSFIGRPEPMVVKIMSGISILMTVVLLLVLQSRGISAK